MEDEVELVDGAAGAVLLVDRGPREGALAPFDGLDAVLVACGDGPGDHAADVVAHEVDF